MINISTLSQFPMGEDDPSLPEAPSYDPPNYETLASNTNGRSSGESSGTDAVENTDAGANTTTSATEPDDAREPENTPEDGKGTNRLLEGESVNRTYCDTLIS